MEEARARLEKAETELDDLEASQGKHELDTEAEMEEVSMLMNTTQKELDTAETVVSEMELQKAEITINQDVSILQERKETVASKLEAEKQKLGELEVRLR